MMNDPNPLIRVRGWHARLTAYAGGAAAVWTLVLAGSLVWSIRQERAHTTQTAAIAASMALERDVAYRSWAASKGGVYVRRSPASPPNPFLADLPERDLTSTTGVRLTLINPAYMTRQVHEIANERFQIRGHVSSLNPLNPANQPDAWERAGLLAFRKGMKDAMSLGQIDGREYFRLQRPFIMESGCLKCHEVQGYHVGDLRGAIAISIPMVSFRAVERARVTHLAVWHGGVWLLGLLVTWGSWRNLSREARAREIAEAKREALVGELQTALRQVRTLSGLIPICAWCKKVRDDSGYWHQVEAYIRSRSGAEFTHGICDDCARDFGRAPTSNDAQPPT